MNIYLVPLIISFLIAFSLFLYVFRMKSKKQIRMPFLAISLIEAIHCLSLIFQILFKNVDPLFFEYFAYISAFLPVAFYYTGLIFAKTKIEFKKLDLLLFVIPIISVLLVWTNNSHHLFYVNYSTEMDKTITGPYFMVHSLYSYCLLFIGLLYLIRYSIKNSGFFSKQSVFIMIGTLIPIVLNILGTFKIIPMSVYITPISFAFAMLFYAIAIFKFQFLKVSPIALQRVVDRMSDAYVVVNSENEIIDFNQAIFNISDAKNSDLRNKNIFDVLRKFPAINIDTEKFKETLNKSKTSSNTFVFEKHFELIDKYFNIEINGIFSNKVFLGTLILFKDVTQHMNDLQTIENNQDMLIERERLASLGQMIGGIAHNLKTPIMSIAGAAEGISDLAKEYNASIDDPEVTSSDHHEIAKEMLEWVEKIKTHTSYMSDVITAVKGQAVVLSEEEVELFTIEELIKRIDILMKHELKNALVELNISVNVPPDFTLKGNINSLIQVINNMISNSIQSYNGKQNQSIDLIVRLQGNNIIISIKDYGSGLPESVKEKLFKEMITTKGKNGTGLGLFMSYSNIRAHFSGNITFESEPGKGTQFNIILPVN